MEHTPSKPKVAIVHDWLVGGGAERVIRELHQLYPEAPIYTSYCTPEWRAKLDGKVVTGFLQHWPFPRLRKLLPILRIWWFGRLDLSAYDLVISSSGNGEAKAARAAKGTVHVCYCNTPIHFYWRHYQQYLAHPGMGVLDPLARLGLRILVGPLRRWDFKAAQKPGFFIANSSHIQSDIRQYYQRDSVVIHPPVDIGRFQPRPGQTPSVRHGFVTVARQIPFKRLDIMVAACTQLKLPLKVIGRGPEHEHLVSMAGPTVTFLSEVSDEEMQQHMAGAQAFLFASHEDFGITPVEAMAAGTPVIAYRAGGALDYVTEGETGIFFDEQTTDALVAALERFQGMRFDEKIITARAEQFSAARFRQKITTFLATVMKGTLKT